MIRLVDLGWRAMPFLLSIGLYVNASSGKWLIVLTAVLLGCGGKWWGQKAIGVSSIRRVCGQSWEEVGWHRIVQGPHHPVDTDN
jgi:hypothetical protein